MITCAQKIRKNTISCLRTIRRKKTRKKTYKYDTQYRGNRSDIHTGVGDQYHSSDRYAQFADMRAWPPTTVSSFLDQVENFLKTIKQIWPKLYLSAII